MQQRPGDGPDIERSVYGRIPAAARMPAAQTDVLWVNNKGDALPQRQVLGERVLIWQQPAAPPLQPQIQVMTDQVLQAVQRPDKYFSYLIMSGYTMDTYAKDVREGFVDLDFPYILVFLGTMQIGVYEHGKFAAEVASLIKAVNQVNPNCHVVFSNLVPRPVDDDRSRKCVNQMSTTIAQEVARVWQQHGWNCGFVNVMEELLDDCGYIKHPDTNFEDMFVAFWVNKPLLNTRNVECSF